MVQVVCDGSTAASEVFVQELSDSRLAPRKSVEFSLCLTSRAGIGIEGACQADM